MIDVAIGLDALLIFVFSALICAIILVTRRHHLGLTDRRGDSGAIQSAHCAPTPRIGGLALITGLLLMAFLLPEELAPRYKLFLPSLLPVLIAGLAEDLGWHVRPRTRLLAAALSSAIAISLLQVWLPRTGLIGLDSLMQWSPFAIAFTIFACAGICNAFNLIDGVNGLSGSVGSIAALAMAAIAAEAGQFAMVEINLLLIAALMGFLVFNFPFGKIFLGDAGAYGLGHILSWFAIALLLRVPDLTPWAILLIFFWPIADTFFAIYRRRRAGRPTDQPDRMHFHQLVMRAIEITLVGRKSRRLANPLSTLTLMPMFAAPALTGVLVWNRPALAIIALCLYSALFIVTYLVGLRLARARRLRPRPLSPGLHSVGQAEPGAEKLLAGE